MSTPSNAHPLAEIRGRIASARPGGGVELVAVSKRQPVAAIRALAAQGLRAFGENYVQEAQAKARELGDLALQWHLIGPLQSNKCREAAATFDWVQTLDRSKLVEPLARHRPPDRPPLDVLVQVNVDDEASKAGVAPAAARALCEAVAAQPRLRLRGLMAIPAPHADLALRRDAFARMRALFDGLRPGFAHFDTLSMGMSEDFELAIGSGATMVRIGTALFGPRG